MSEFAFPSDLKIVKKASLKIIDQLKDLKLDEITLFKIVLCSEEALINAIKYGNKNKKEQQVKVSLAKNLDSIEITVKDEGKGFDYKNLPDPTTDENLTKTSGRGLFLIKKLMDKVIFYDNGSCIKMIKHIKK
ncbi:MAG: ATP-binding protein [Candidatus Omnitrophota bacterium]